MKKTKLKLAKNPRNNPIISLFRECGNEMRWPTVLSAIEWLDEIGVLEVYFSNKKFK